MPEESTYSLKKIIIFGIIILIITGFIGFYFITKKNSTSPDTQGNKNLFPFGDGTESTTGSNSPVATGGNVDTTGTPQPSDGTAIATTNDQRLRQITIYPVTGFFSSIIQHSILEPKLDEKTQQTTLVARTIPMNKIRWNIKQTGILMDAEISNDAIITTQKTATRSPDAREIWFTNNGDTIFFRGWDGVNRSITTFVGTVPKPPTLDYCGTTLTQDLKVGSKTSDVRELQKYLNKKLSLNLAVDGVLGTKTFALVKQIQIALNLPETGVYDVKTREGINADCVAIVTAFNKQKNAPVELNSTFLQKDISRGAVSPDGAQIFLFVPADGGVMGMIGTSNGSGLKKVFESAASEWSAQWVNKDIIALTTLASREADGYLYFLNPSTGAMKKILGPIRGLTTLVSPDGKTVFYSTSTDRGFATKTYATDTGSTQNIDLATIPSKCTWQDTSTLFCGVPKTLPTGQYPDNWYQGTVSFNDVLWAINVSQNTTRLIVSPDQTFDMVHLGVSPDGNYIYFINKTDETLWSYRLN